MKQPNFNNKRTQKRIKNGLGYVLAVFGTDDTRSKDLYCRDIEKEFSSMSFPTGKFLHDKLLICTNTHWSMYSGKVKQYKINLKGVADVATIMGIDREYNGFTGLTDRLSKLSIDLGVQWAIDKYNFDEIEYTQKSNRYWHPIQNLPKEIRNGYLVHHGLTEQYDVECCAQTLLHQAYLQQVKKPKNMMYLESYLKDRSSIRRKIADDVGISVEDVKVILTAMNNNSKLQADNRCKTFANVGYDKYKVILFNTHPFITGYKRDISEMWKELGKSVERGTITTKTGQTRKAMLNGKHKSSMYFGLEKQVMDVAYNYLDTHNKKYIKLHDAFVTETLTTNQVGDITTQIKEITNYSINLDREVLCSN